MSYEINLVSGAIYAPTIRELNSLEPSFPPLADHHLNFGLWWIVTAPNGTVAGFAGLVEFTPFHEIGYLKRGFIKPEHRGHRLQADLINRRIEKARFIGMHALVTDCAADAIASQKNLIRCGFVETVPEQRWTRREDDVYFVKRLT